MCKSANLQICHPTHTLFSSQGFQGADALIRRFAIYPFADC
jgi:hypothetical protein